MLYTLDICIPVSEAPLSRYCNPESDYRVSGLTSSFPLWNFRPIANMLAPLLQISSERRDHDIIISTSFKALNRVTLHIAVIQKLLKGGRKNKQIQIKKDYFNCEFNFISLSNKFKTIFSNVISG